MPGSMMQPDLSGVTATGGTRAAALARWQDNGWPGPRVEAWRYTSLAKLSDIEIAPVASLAGSASGPGMAAATGIAAHVIRFENGVVDPAGLTGLPGGVTVGVDLDYQESLIDKGVLKYVAALSSWHSTCKDAANRWTDNIFLVSNELAKHTGADMDRFEQLYGQFEYVE